MNDKTLTTLEFDKVLARLARHTSFSAGRELALALRPSTDYDSVVRNQRLTAEARRLRETKPRTGLGGVHDVRALANKANLGGVLEPSDLLDVASTLTAGRDLKTTITRLADPLPLLAEIAGRISALDDVIADVNRCINTRAEVVDAASPALAVIRRDLHTVHDRLYAKLQELIASPGTRQAIQEPVITQRDGRYVIPVKVESRGQVQGIVHDVSASGATVFVEPLAVVELGNTWRETQAEEQREVERILRRLSSLAGRFAHAIAVNIDSLAEIDLALAKARLADDLDAFELPYDGEPQPWLVPAPDALHLVNARHPLLTRDIVPISLSVGGGYSVLLITGPNTGGKTVALKTVGLLIAMAQAGLPVPADAGSRLPVFASVHADIGDEQSIEQSLSTFSSHMTNTIGILQSAGPNSLVLLDELGAGTDPDEGSALARALIERLLEIGCLTVATTHHGELKIFAHTTTGIMNASVEFDLETLAPTYRISIGLPGASNAIAIAERLGLPAGIVAAARGSIEPDRAKAESLLAEIQRERSAAEDARRGELIARKESEEIRLRLEEKLDAIEEEREQILANARAEAEEELSRIRQLLAHAGRRIERQKPEAAAEKVAAAEAVAETLKPPPPSPRRRRRKHGDLIPPEEIEAGDLVWVRGLGRFGEALSPPDDKGEVEVRLGSLHSKVPLKKVEKVQRVKLRGPAIGGTAVVPPPPSVPMEIEVRGRLVDEVLPDVDKYLDDAFRAGLPWVRIVHGKGTGALARAVRQMLSTHPLVKDYEVAPREEGGEGVTIAHLAS
ncbi:MAG: endonuclease MutS2 [Dehalococcoidia bacterium]|jgi:DNA mismatch repair protein MutS2